MLWQFNSGSPIYSQLIHQIKQGIVSGIFPPGERLPSVRDLATEAGVNPNTMQRALTELEREGLLIGGGTSGRTVTKEEKVLEAMRQQALEDLARECVEKFKVFGITPAQAAEIMLHVKEEEK